MAKYHHHIFLIDSWILDASFLPPVVPQIAHFSVVSVVYWPVHPVATDFPGTVGEPEHAVFASLIPLHLSDLTRPSSPKRQKVSHDIPPSECSRVFSTEVFYYLKPASFERSGQQNNSNTSVIIILLRSKGAHSYTSALYTYIYMYVYVGIWVCSYPTCLNHLFVLLHDRAAIKTIYLDLFFFLQSNVKWKMNVKWKPNTTHRKLHFHCLC